MSTEFQRNFIHCFCYSVASLIISAMKVNTDDCSVILWGGEGLLRNEDTIQELSLILVADVASLVGSSAGKGERGIVNSVENELILNVLGLEDSGAWWKLNEMRFLSSKEVSDFKNILLLADDTIDGEVIVHKSHLVSEALIKQKHIFSFMIRSTL